ncbi:MAG: hypothetical protein QM817_12025 [Archangium sp.]
MKAIVLVAAKNLQAAMAPFALERRVEPYDVTLTDAQVRGLVALVGKPVNLMTDQELNDVIVDEYDALSGHREGKRIWYRTDHNPRGAWDWYTAHRALPLSKPERLLGGLIQNTHAAEATVASVDLEKLMADPFPAVLVGDTWHHQTESKEEWAPRFRQLVSELPPGVKVWSVLYHS